MKADLYCDICVVLIILAIDCALYCYPYDPRLKNEAPQLMLGNAISVSLGNTVHF